jgi:hypothetical protein
MKATVKSFAVDHTPSLTAPGKVVGIILEAAETTLSQTGYGFERRSFMRANHRSRKSKKVHSDDQYCGRSSIRPPTLSDACRSTFCMATVRGSLLRSVALTG